MKYIALLRGINVGGKSKVSMPELKKSFESLGYENVSTYINSGNVIFDSNDQEATLIQQKCEEAIMRQFGFHVACCVLSKTDLLKALDHAPSWWDVDKDAKHNALFVIAPETAERIMQEVGEAKTEYEKVSAYGQIIFWSAPLTTFSRTRYSKIVGTKSYQSITIRNANTTKKLASLV